MSVILYYNPNLAHQLIELGVLDESASYEVDITEVHYDPEKEEFVLLTASGCSCWDGDYSEERFKTLEEIEASLIRDERQYTPSFRGASQLIIESKLNWEREKKKLTPKVVQVGAAFMRPRKKKDGTRDK